MPGYKENRRAAAFTHQYWEDISIQTLEAIVKRDKDGLLSQLLLFNDAPGKTPQ
jgi:hypothetical protein